MTNISGGSGILRKSIKSATPAKSESKRNDIFDKLVLTIYKMGDSERVQ